MPTPPADATAAIANEAALTAVSTLREALDALPPAGDPRRTWTLRTDPHGAPVRLGRVVHAPDDGVAWVIAGGRAPGCRRGGKDGVVAAGRADGGPERDFKPGAFNLLWSSP